MFFFNHRVFKIRQKSIKLFKSIFNDEFIVPNSTCFAKAYNRTTSTINEFIYLKKPCSDFSVSLNKKPKEVLSNFYSRWKLPFPYYGTIHREVLRLPKFEVCEILNNTVLDNILLHHIKQALSSG